MSKSGDERFELRDAILRLWRGKWWIIGSAVFFTGAFIVAAYRITPIYRATAVVIPADAEGEAGGLGAAMRSFAGTASLLGLNLGGGGRDNTDESLAVLRSRPFLEKFVTDNGLMPVLFSKHWDATRSAWRQPGKAPTHAQAYNYLRNDILQVAEDRTNSLVRITVEWRDREQAAAWANELIARLNSEMRDRALREAGDSVEYLQAEMAKTSLLGVQSAISRIIEAQINKQMLANVTQEYALRVVEPALPPDEGDVAWPDKKVVAALGLLLGGLVGIAAALLAGTFRRA